MFVKVIDMLRMEELKHIEVSYERRETQDEHLIVHTSSSTQMFTSLSWSHQPGKAELSKKLVVE